MSCDVTAGLDDCALVHARRSGQLTTDNRGGTTYAYRHNNRERLGGALGMLQSGTDASREVDRTMVKVASKP